MIRTPFDISPTFTVATPAMRLRAYAWTRTGMAVKTPSNPNALALRHAP